MQFKHLNQEDILTGTDTDPALNNSTKNFTVQSIVDLANGGGGGTPVIQPCEEILGINIEVILQQSFV